MTQSHVLVVDDDPSLLRMIRILLESEDFVVTTARNGREALDHVSASDVEPSVVILDMQMPVLDGRGFFREFRSRGYSAPVIVISAFNADAACAELGAEGSIDKPFEPFTLAARVRAAIRKA